MKKAALRLLTLMIICFAVTISFSQNNLTGNLPAADIFVGSTPCDSLIKSLLQIPSSGKCDFIKWELSFLKSSPNTYQLIASYGESQPNTNGFIDGGKKIAVNGKFVIDPGRGANPNEKIYYLYGEKLKSSLLLVKMDSNIFHFADADKNFIVGNGGWGYVLNKIQ